jgi:hypothetical protein
MGAARAGESGLLWRGDATSDREAQVGGRARLEGVVAWAGSAVAEDTLCDTGLCEQSDDLEFDLTGEVKYDDGGEELVTRKEGIVIDPGRSVTVEFVF